ncbi:MAG: hypothetical protein R3E73_09235 [Porticoccaceae bacterium]
MDKECRKLSLGEWVKKHIKRAWCKLTPLNLNQHHDQLIETLEELQDAITRKESGTAARRTTQLAAKVGAGTATSSVMMGLAGLFGSASTGTAIGTLSGAAFTSSALAWIGGTVATGGAIVSGAGIAVGVGSFFGAKWAWQKYLSGKPREDSDLTEEESVIQLSIDSILIGLRKFPENDRESYAYHALWLHALTPIIDKLESLYDIRYSSWPALAKRRIRIGLKKLKKLRNKAQGRLATEMSVPVSTFSVVVMQLMSGYSEFSSDQLLVLDAFRRSTPKLAGASPDEIADYLRSYSDESLPGVLANVKGIYHELYYVELENSDGDDWGAEIMGSVSHEAVDVRLTNLRTGEVKMFS